MGNPTKEQLKAISFIIGKIGGYPSDSVVATVGSTDLVVGTTLTGADFSLVGGCWIVFGQANYQVAASSDSEVEIQLTLSVEGGNPNVSYNCQAFTHLAGGTFGTATVIGALNFEGNLEELATAKLTYVMEANPGPNSSSSLVVVLDQILVAIKTTNLLVL